MKMKVKFNSAAIKNFLLEHGEKFALGGALLLFVALGYGAVSRDTLPADKAPDRLAAAAQAAQSHVADSKFDPATLELPLQQDYVSKTKRRLIDVADYTGGIINDPIGEPMQKRSDPQLVAAEGMRASAGAGTFALKGKDDGQARTGNQPRGRAPRPPRRDADEDDILGGGAARAEIGRAVAANVVIPGIRPPAGSQMKPTYWALVTAVVPYRKQTGEFDKVFETALGGDPNRDFPQYLGYRIWRAEDNGSDPDQLKWTKINVKDAQKATESWAIDAPELVDPAYVDKMFTMPLGPLVGAYWTPDIGHHPEIPFAQGKMQGVDDEGAAEEMGDDEAPDAEAGDDEEFGDMADQRPATARAGAARLAQNEDDGDAPPARRVMPVPQRPAPAARGVKKQGRENDVLFRFYDFTVEPGKTYRYKVQLVLENPNFGVEAKFLKGGEVRKERLAFTPESQPSPAVTVPFTDGVLAHTVQRNLAKIAVYKIDEASGLEVLTTEEFPRGGAVNFTKTVSEVLNPVNSQIVSQENVRFVTNSVVVDMHGGKPLDAKDRNQTEAGEVLLIDRDGNLVVHDEMDDLPTFEAKDPSKLMDGSAPQSKGAPNWGGILEQESKPAKTVVKKAPRSGRTRAAKPPKTVAPKPAPAAKKRPVQDTSPD